PSTYLFSVTRVAPSSILFPYTTLFRSSQTNRGHCKDGVDEIPCAVLLRWTLIGVLEADEETQSVVGRDARGLRQPRSSAEEQRIDRKSTRLNSSHVKISYAVLCLIKKK